MTAPVTPPLPEGLRPAQRAAILAAYLGWTLDAFDFFLMVLLVPALAAQFGASVKAVSEALFLTLAARPAGALVFGWLADRFGRRPVLIAVILLFSAFSAASGLAGSLPQLLWIRAAFGFAMGGEWGVGASLVMASIPARLRGRVSGLVQAGYPSGYLLAALAYATVFPSIGWRGMFFLGLAPALLVALVRMRVEEPPAEAAGMGEDAPGDGTLATLARHWRLAAYLIVLMTAFNLFSHGTQDLYPTFLQAQHHFTPVLTGRITALMNVGAIAGALCLGALSDRIGRRQTVALAACLALPALWPWAYGGSVMVLAAGAFAIQFAVQGAWGVVPAHLNELAPPGVRAMFPGLVYQLGNLIASRNAPLQAGIAEAHGGDYALALVMVAGGTALVLAVWSMVGPEASPTRAV